MFSGTSFSFSLVWFRGRVSLDRLGNLTWSGDADIVDLGQPSFSELDALVPGYKVMAGLEKSSLLL